MANEIQVWNKVLSTALQMPGVKVNRKDFIEDKLSLYCNSSQLIQALDKGPIGIIPFPILDKVAEECINYHTRNVTALSSLAGLPGGWWVAATIPADLAQYYFHVFVLSQKLAYIYGFPDLCDKDGNLTEDASNLLTIFVGVMGGVAVANEAIQEIARQLQKEVVRRLPQQALTKGVFYPMVKQIAKWIGIKLTKESFAKGVGKLIPIVGALISGGLTYATFKPQSKRLMRTLRNTMMIASENRKVGVSNDAEDVSFEEVKS